MRGGDAAEDIRQFGQGHSLCGTLVCTTCTTFDPGCRLRARLRPGAPRNWLVHLMLFSSFPLGRWKSSLRRTPVWEGWTQMTRGWWLRWLLPSGGRGGVCGGGGGGGGAPPLLPLPSPLSFERERCGRLRRAIWVVIMGQGKWFPAHLNGVVVIATFVSVLSIVPRALFNNLAPLGLGVGGLTEG